MKIWRVSHKGFEKRPGENRKRVGSEVPRVSILFEDGAPCLQKSRAIYSKGVN